MQYTYTPLSALVVYDIHNAAARDALVGLLTDRYKFKAEGDQSTMMRPTNQGSISLLLFHHSLNNLCKENDFEQGDFATLCFPRYKKEGNFTTDDPIHARFRFRCYPRDNKFIN